MSKEHEENDLIRQVQAYANDLTNGFNGELNEDGEEIGAHDYIRDAFDIEFIVTREREYLGARVLVAIGGPTIWIDTHKGIVEGWRWSAHATEWFKDNIGLDDALEELWDCS
jgi:hypothetical protein